MVIIPLLNKNATEGYLTVTIAFKDTICALATAPLAAGVAVIRLSGKQAKEAVLKLAPSFEDVPARKLHYTELVLDGVGLDQVLLSYFKGPFSFTGEDVVEIHCHGGKAVIKAVMDALLVQENIRSAGPGEFSRRAFLNGKMDLTEAEGLADLIEAETEEQRRQALNQLGGELGQKFEQWREQAMLMLAHIEAAIDFPDEELDVLEDAGLKEKLHALKTDLDNAVAQDVGERIREGFNVVVVGKPNAGKSTLTNLLSGKETAIVSPIAGTTRDVVEAHLNISGFPIVLADTAGLRESDDVIEQEGVKRALKRAEQGDLVIMVVDAHDFPNLEKEGAEKLRKERSLVIVSKVDEVNKEIPETITYNEVDYPVVSVNLADQQNAGLVIDALKGLIEKAYAKASGAAMLTRERHKSSVNQALQSLNRAIALYEQGHSMSVSELLAQDMRDVAHAIGTVTGRTDTEDVLDLVFSTFCIGK